MYHRARKTSGCTSMWPSSRDIWQRTQHGQHVLVHQSPSNVPCSIQHIQHVKLINSINTNIISNIFSTETSYDSTINRRTSLTPTRRPVDSCFTELIQMEVKHLFKHKDIKVSLCFVPCEHTCTSTCIPPCVLILVRSNGHTQGRAVEARDSPSRDET